MVLGSSGTEYRYFIPCQDGQAAEVLPFPVTTDGAFWNFYWWGRRPAARSSAPAVGGLDPVERQLAVAGCDWNGLPVAARALRHGIVSAMSGTVCSPRIRLLSWPPA